jgi:hypothetical protein
MPNEIHIVFSEDAVETYSYLKEHAITSKIARSLISAIDKKVEIIKRNRNYGQVIPRNLIPREYQLKYDVTTVFRVELPDFWRMLYTVKKESNEIEVLGFILDIVNHKKYNKIFGYK